MKNIPQNWFPVILLLFLTTKGYTQLNAVTIGDAQSIGNNCYVITENVGWQSGGVWYDNPIDFNEDFTIYYKNNFGNNDSNGADGMALVFKTTSTPDVGDSGGGVGYEGIQNSLIVEFDTWQNTDRNDPFYDHLSIMINGNASHSSPNNLVGPVPPTSTSNNMEDGLDHNVKIIWAASTQTFEVFFDCELRLTLNRDIKGTIFGGDSTVFFGFVGSTGGSSNLHQVCFNSISFVDNLVLQPQTICIGESAQVDAEIPSGNTYTWSPSTGVSDVNIPNPTLSPNTTTTYTVTIEDECGEATIESVEITVTPQNTTTFDPIDPICEGDSNPLPTTDINGVTGSWTPAFDATATTDYSFTPDPGQCATTPAPVQVVVNPIITTTFDPIDPICEGDSNPLPTTDLNGVTGSWTPAFDATATTDYSFTPDPGQCATTPAPVQVVVNPIITTTFDPIDPICEGDSNPLPTTDINGVTGSWTPAFDATATTDYSFTPDPGQCATTPAPVQVVVNPIITTTFDPIDPICEGDSNPLPTTDLNGVTGSWTPAFDATATTDYSFTPDPGQCATTPAPVQVVVNPIITTTFDPIDPICEGDSNPLPTTDLNGVTGSWTPAFDATATTDYSFTPDPGQCATTPAPVQVVVNPIITTTFDPIDPICEGDSNPLPTTDINGVTGSWTPAFDATATTDYSFTPDPGQCATTPAPVQVVVNPIITTTFDPIDPICEGDSNPLPTTDLNGVTGSWTPAFDATATTDYSFTPDPGQCATTPAPVQVVVNPIITTTFDPIDPICEGDSNPLPTTDINGVTGSWTPAFDATATTDYSFTPDPGQCATTPAPVQVVVNPIITTTFDPIDPICEGDSNPLPTTDLNGVTGSWTPAFDATATTDYSFTPDPGQCATTPAPVQVVVNPIVTPAFDSIDPICAGDIIAPLPTTSNNGITGTWNPATIDNTTTDVYTFTPDAGVCVIPTTIEITVLQQITPTFLIDDICIGESTAQLPVVSEENISGSWSPATVNNLVTTTYTFTPDPGQCANTTTETINVNPINTLSIATENTSAPFDSNQIIEVTVTGGSGNYEYQLDGGIWQNSPVFQNVIGCQEHIVKVRDEEGCSNEPESVVTILSYPKFFTPNGDGYNDFWNIECLKNRTGLISIFDRFGKLLKQFKTTSSGWNGSYNDALMPTSDYWFMVRYFDENGLEKEFRSHFTLRR